MLSVDFKGKDWVNIYYFRRYKTRYHLVKAGHILICNEASDLLNTIEN